MIKTAVFVEGQSELIFTRELLLKYLEYQNIWLECYNLFNDQNLNPTEYSFPNKSAAYYFQIINVGNDQKVISSILKREKYLFSESQKFHKVIGLRDMYSKDYIETVMNTCIDPLINQKFILSNQQVIKLNSLFPEKISFHFAIMELEAWLLSVSNIFDRFHEGLSNEVIKERLGVDLKSIKTESEVFHPADLINRILRIVGDSYDKKKAELNKFLALIEKEDFNDLLKSEKCESFNRYFEALLIHLEN